MQIDRLTGHENGKNISGVIVPTETDSSLVRDLIDDATSAGPYPAASSGGRGIVICAGGPVMLTNAYVLVRVLRDIHKSDLPIEIWHLGAQEMPGLMATVFIELGCRIVDASSGNRGTHGSIRDGWQLKSYAVKSSGFEDVLLLDADQVPLADPEMLFDCPQYLGTGAIFWPDIIDLSAENPIWPMLGLEPERVRSWESGQLCVNRKKHWKAINVALAMNERAETFYRLIYGDKDTFLLAWRLSGSECAVVPHSPFQSERFLCQRDFDGKPLFQHRTNCKWSLNEANVNPTGFRLFDECDGFLNELKNIWNGQIFVPPVRNLAAQQMESDLVRTGHFTYLRGSETAQRIELLPGHQVGAGRSPSLMNWCVCHTEGENQLTFYDHHKPVAKLTVGENGHCQGKTLTFPMKMAQLDPLENQETSPLDRQANAGVVGDLVRASMLARAHDSAYLEKLTDAIRLLCSIDPGIVEQTRTVADIHASAEPALSDHLYALASDLSCNDRAHGTSPFERSPHEQLGDKRLYVRP